MLGLFKMEFLVGQLYVLVLVGFSVFLLIIMIMILNIFIMYWFTHIVTLSEWDFIIRFGTVK